MGELLIRKFASFSASFGVKVKDIKNNTGTEAGDYNTLTVLRNTNLAYFECKTGDFDGDSIMKCYRRMLSLNCEYSILICLKKIDVEKLIWDSSKVRVPVTQMHCLNKIHIKNNPDDILYDVHNCYIIDMYGNIENKIKIILRFNSAKINQLHFEMWPDNDSLGKLGYNVETIKKIDYRDE